MNEETKAQIEELKIKARDKFREVKELKKRIYKLQVECMDIELGSVLTQTSTNPYCEEFDEYLVIMSKSKVLFVNTSYWISDYDFDSLYEAKEYMKRDTDYKWELKSFKGELK